MCEQNVEKRLKDTMDLYEKKLFVDKNPYRVYSNLLQFNELYRKTTGKIYLDKDVYETKYPNLFKKISKIKNNNLIDRASNCFDFYDFCNNELPYILNNVVDLLEPTNKPSASFDDINSSDIRALVSEFYKYINFENKELVDYFCKNNYLINFNNLSDDTYGIIYFDLLGKEDYICIKTNDRLNLEIAATYIHEFEHEDDVRKLDMRTKYKYVTLSPYIEVLSHLFQNKFYDYLIEENINKDFARIAKYDLMEDSIYQLSNCIIFFDSFGKCNVRNDMDISKYIRYGFGKFISVCTLNDKESFDTFKKIHYNIFDTSLLDKININEDKCKKVFCKELNKIYK